MNKPLKKLPQRMEIHGDIRIDDYFWMRERDTPDVLEYLRAENERTAEAMKPVKGLEEKLYHEMRSRIKEDDSSVPAFQSGYWYYARYQEKQEYAIHCRKIGTLDAPEEVIFDENVMARDHEYFEVAKIEVAPDQNLMAYAVDVVGRRIYEIRFKNLQTGELLSDRIEITTPYFAWAKDCKTLFFARQDLETLRSYQIYKYVVGSGKHPELVFEEKDNTFNVYVFGSKSDDVIFMGILKRDSTEFRFLDSAKPNGEWQTFLPREDKHEYSLFDGGDRFYILTNWQAENFRLMEAPKTSRTKEEWKEIVPHSAEIFLEDIDVYKNFVVISQRQNGLAGLRVMDRKTGQFRFLGFPDPVYEMHELSLPSYESEHLRFAYESMVQPPSVYEEKFDGTDRRLMKVREVPGYDSSLYESHRLWAKAGDGVLVPLSIVHRKGLQLDGRNPVLLYGYGSYGHSNTAHFSSSMMSLVDRGFVFAKAHIRGGSEMGRGWYEKGRLKYKLNTFTDFIACAEKLIGDKYTSPEHMHIRGGSAGGLLVGAVMNMRPDLFKSVSAGVPFVDVMSTMLDESIPLTTGEYNEWGDPRIAEDYKYMRQYSPYDNIERKNYPHVLATTGYHDSQVQYWEPAKWIAKLREMRTDQGYCLLYTEFEAGHGGASGRFEALKLLAKELAFILLVEGKLN